MLFVRAAELRRERVPSFDAYPFNLPAVRQFGRLEFSSPVTVLVGENGTGKSTLLEALAVAAGFNPEGGSKNFAFGTRPSHSELHTCLRLVRAPSRPRDGYFLRAESFFNVATQIEELDKVPGAGPRIIDSYGGRSLHEQSHGESFLTLLQERFRGSGLYLLDEPEAALSPTRQLAALARMHQLVEAGSQFILATHSPILMAYPGAQLLGLSDSGIAPLDYDQTEHVVVMRHFINDRETLLAELLREDGA
ncbi:MAG TPA: AAA family ATPase [Gemmatimonadales bacterium]|nr:AAA family ATPase [Gemmatimonadales bacterium]